jgi:hypothetical protein
MANRHGIRITKENENALFTITAYLYQLLSSRNAFKELSQGVADVDTNHNVTDGIPMVMSFRIVDSNTVQAMGNVEVTDSQILTTYIPGISFFYRVFYNKQTEA